MASWRRTSHLSQWTRLLGLVFMASRVAGRKQMFCASSCSRPMESFPATAAELLRRTPQRMTTTISWALHQRLVERATNEGRSVSNLMAHLLEVACPE
jgi:predicted HicB family RNase H-like nuclease